MDERTVNQRTGGPVGRGPSFGHFYLLVVLILIVAGSVGYLFVALRGADDGIRTELGDSATNLQAALEQQQKTLRVNLGELEVSLEATSKKVDGLASELGKLRGDLGTMRAGLDGRFEELSAKDAKLAVQLQAKSEELSTQIGVVQSGFAEEQKSMKAVVTQIQDDSKYIVSELGKKAEKAYMRFMERKLKKKISAVSEKVDTVSEKVDTVKIDLEQQIGATHTKIAEMVGTVGETIKAKVEEHNKINFVLSETDKD
jgi:chromosome segregation ATPase